MSPYTLWKSRGIRNYTIDQSRHCFCGHGGETMRLVVCSNDVRSVTRLSDMTPIPSPASESYLDIDSLFGIIRHPGADSIRVSYHPVYGYPERLEINPHLQPVDGGVTYLLSNLQDLSDQQACDDPVSIGQGAWGIVRFWEGDFMPVTPTGTITPVVREVFVYEATRFDSVGGVIAGGFCDTIFTRFVTSVFSGTDGFFEVELAPGKYSFFVREDTLYYANSWDRCGHIQPATVYPDSVTERPIDITYKATF